MTDEYVRIWKDSVAFRSSMLFWHFPRDAEEKYENVRQDQGQNSRY
jgi:hypothetical protein